MPGCREGVRTDRRKRWAGRGCGGWERGAEFPAGPSAGARKGKVHPES